MKTIKFITHTKIILLLLFTCLFCLCRKTNDTLLQYQPSVTSLSPDTGTVNTLVTIKGKNFSLVLSDDTVKFNGALATVKQTTDTTIQVYAPADGSTGPVTVSIFGQQVKAPVFTYSAIAPGITGIAPTSGIAGTQVTITGNNFIADTSKNIVYFNGVRAVMISATVTQLVVTAPNSTTGNVKVITNGLTANGPVYTYLSSPLISSINPNTGPAGTHVTIIGNNFVADTSKNIVYFNGVRAAMISATVTQLVVIAPNSTTGNVKVTSNGLTANGPVYTYPSSPVISSINPNNGPVGTHVTITGSNFVADTSKNIVYFNGVRAAMISATATQLVVIAPNSTTGNVKVTTNGLTTNGPVYTYPSAPVISSINPTAGQAGTHVTITGSNFVADTSKNIIYFNGVRAAMISATTTQIVVIAPASTTGTVSIAVNGFTVNGPVFTYVIAPVITSVVNTPSGILAILGQHFDSLNSVVQFDGQTISGFTYSTNAYGGQTLSKAFQSLPTNLGNPVQITVSVKGVVSNAYQQLFTPELASVSSDTVIKNQTITLQGYYFGNRSVPSSVTAYYLIGGQQTALPSPTIVSWATNSIQVTIPNWDTYSGNRYLKFVILVNVDTGSSGFGMVYDSQK